MRARHWLTLAATSVLWFALTAATPRPPLFAGAPKADYGHYFATNGADTPADAAMLCAKPGVSGIVWRQSWAEVETSPGVYDWRSFDAVVSAVRPGCRVWLLIEWKSFSPDNPCPAYLRAAFSAPTSNGVSCFMWDPYVRQRFGALLTAAGKRYDANAKVEGVVLQESSTSFIGAYAQEPPVGTYSAEAWRDGLIDLSRRCAAAFPSSRCMQFLNFIRGGNGYLDDVAQAIAAIPRNQACVSGPDLLPGSTSLATVYAVIRAHRGCRANSAQNDSFEVTGCDLGCIFDFATHDLCLNSYVFWNHRVGKSATGLDWTNALPVIAAHPYGQAWLAPCGSQPP